MKIWINQEGYEFPQGITILKAIKMAGIDISTLCYDERLEPYGGCRLCIVKVDGVSQPVTSCNTLLSEGMRIETHTPEIVDLRKTLLKLLSQNYPSDAIQTSPEKVFHRYLMEYGIQPEGSSTPHLLDDSHPYINWDRSRCIYCYRCVRICEDLQGQFVWQVWYRGDNTRILPDSGKTLLKSTCVSCGGCVDTCPTGALEDKDVAEYGSPSRWVHTTCPYCGVGCEIRAGTGDEGIVQIRPIYDNHVNKGHLCSKGRYAFRFIYAEDRVKRPMIKVDGSWKEVSWEEAIGFTAGEMKRIIERYGSDSIGVLTSSRATNEENYLLQKFARTVLGTNNVDCCARVCHHPSAAALGLMLGTGAGTNSFDDIEDARTILLFGTNTTENHPVVGARIKEAVLRGARLIVVDPRRIELADFAEIYLPIRPGTNVPLLNAMANIIVEEGFYNEGFISERVDGWEGFKDFIKGWSPERVAPICGVDARLIRDAAILYARERPSMSFHGLGLTEHTQGTEGVMCLVNLALITGNMGKVGTGVNPLRGQNNVQGAALMGCGPSYLTGGINLGDGTPLFERVWRHKIPSRKGLNLIDMIDSSARGELKALWIVGYDIFLTNPDANYTRRALERLELVIIQDMFLTETARWFGKVFLPACSSFEKDGTFMNWERRVQRVRKVIEPIGDSRPDWEIVSLLARAMGKGDIFNYNSPEGIWDEIGTVWEKVRGITYHRLDKGGIQWPCHSQDHPGTRVLHTESFPIGKKARLQCIEYIPTRETISQDFPFLMVTGRNLYHFNADTMTERTKHTRIYPFAFLKEDGEPHSLWVSTEDADQFGLEEGRMVKVVSRYGETTLPVHITSRMKKGEVFATFHRAQAFLNHITGPYHDSLTKTPEYKVTAVRIEAV